MAPLDFIGFNQDSTQHWGCLINGKNFSYPDPEPFDLPLGSIIHWPWVHTRV